LKIVIALYYTEKIRKTLRFESSKLW